MKFRHYLHEIHDNENYNKNYDADRSYVTCDQNYYKELQKKLITNEWNFNNMLQSNFVKKKKLKYLVSKL